MRRPGPRLGPPLRPVLRARPWWASAVRSRESVCAAWPGRNALGAPGATAGVLLAARQPKAARRESAPGNPICDQRFGAPRNEGRRGVPAVCPIGCADGVCRRALGISRVSLREGVAGGLFSDPFL